MCHCFPADKMAKAVLAFSSPFPHTSLGAQFFSLTSHRMKISVHSCKLTSAAGALDTSTLTEERGTPKPKISQLYFILWFGHDLKHLADLK